MHETEEQKEEVISLCASVSSSVNESAFQAPCHLAQPCLTALLYTLHAGKPSFSLLPMRQLNSAYAPLSPPLLDLCSS